MTPTGGGPVAFRTSRFPWFDRRVASAGQSLVEFALVVPVLLGLVIGIFEFGRAWNVRQVLTNAAREGAREAVITGTPQSDVEDTIESRLSDANLDPGLATITISGINSGAGQPTSVTIQYPYEFLFVGPIVQVMQGDGSCPLGTPPGCAPGGTINMSTTITMRNE